MRFNKSRKRHQIHCGNNRGLAGNVIGQCRFDLAEEVEASLFATNQLRQF